MNNNIEKITIESLFQSENETLYVILRQRAIEAKMLVSEFHEIFIAAQRSGFIELDTLGNVKLMGDIEPYLKIYRNEIKVGTKCPNKLCEAVLQDMKNIRSCYDRPSVKIVEEDDERYGSSILSIEDWEKELLFSIEKNAKQFRRCTFPKLNQWTGTTGTKFLSAYASESAYVNSAAFITIAVAEKED